MSREKNTEEDSQTDIDDIRNLFTVVKREGTVFLKVGRAMGGGKRASKYPNIEWRCALGGTNNDKHDLRFEGAKGKQKRKFYRPN